MVENCFTTWLMHGLSEGSELCATDYTCAPAEIDAEQPSFSGRLFLGECTFKEKAGSSGKQEVHIVQDPTGRYLAVKMATKSSFWRTAYAGYRQATREVILLIPLLASHSTLAARCPSNAEVHNCPCPPPLTSHVRWNLNHRYILRNSISANKCRLPLWWW